MSVWYEKLGRNLVHQSKEAPLVRTDEKEKTQTDAEIYQHVGAEINDLRQEQGWRPS